MKTDKHQAVWSDASFLVVDSVINEAEVNIRKQVFDRVRAETYEGSEDIAYEYTYDGMESLL